MAVATVQVAVAMYSPGLFSLWNFKPCKPPSTNSSNSSSVWTELTDTPVCGASLATLRGHVLAIGGRKKGHYGSEASGAIHCYDRSTDSWSVIGEMPTPRSDSLVAVLSNGELIVVGGYETDSTCHLCEIGSIN